MSEKVTVKIPKEIHTKLKVRAAKEAKTIESVVAETLKKGMSK